MTGVQTCALPISLLAQYPRKDFSPTLAYQIWSVLKVDQNAPGASAEQLARLKREYPLSRLSRPETVMKVYLPEDGNETGSARSEVFSGEAPLMIRGVREISPETQRTDERTPENLFDKMIQPINFVQGFFRSVSAEVFFKMGRFAAALEPDKIYTQVVDNSKARDCLEHFLPSFARKVINRYEVNFDGEGVTLSMEMNMGFSYLKVISRGAVIVRGGEGARHMELDLRDMKVQGMTVPATFLAQIENGVNDAERGANMPLDMVDIQYWPGSAKFVFKKKL